jgi:hypothetical protein
VLPSEPPRETIFKMITGCRNTQALYVVAKLGVADLLVNGPLTAEELAEKLEVKPRPLFRVMRALAAQGIFAQDANDRFGLTPLSQLLREDNPQSLRYAAINIGEEYYRAAGELLYTVKTGETAFDHMYGKGHFEYMAEHPESSRTFNRFMSQGISALGNDPFQKAYDFARVKVVVDVGGGNGTLISSILRSNPELEGILFDLPQAVTEAPKLLSVQGVEDRCQIVTGSFFDSVPPGGDVYILSRILHDWSDEKAKLILQNCRKAIKEDGALIIQEAIIPEGDTPSQGKQVDLTMLFLTGGMERTKREWSELLRESGFEFKRAINTGQTWDLIEAKPM